MIKTLKWINASQHFGIYCILNAFFFARFKMNFYRNCEGFSLFTWIHSEFSRRAHSQFALTQCDWMNKKKKMQIDCEKTIEAKNEFFCINNESQRSHLIFFFIFNFIVCLFLRKEKNLFSFLLKVLKRAIKTNTQMVIMKIIILTNDTPAPWLNDQN